MTLDDEGVMDDESGKSRGRRGGCHKLVGLRWLVVMRKGMGWLWENMLARRTESNAWLP